MSDRIVLVLAHPALKRKSFCEALADAYQAGAEEAGHEVRRLHLAHMQFDLILHEGYAEKQELEPDLQKAQDDIRWANHLVMIYPMWAFMPPALLKCFMERAFTEGFAYDNNAKNPLKCGLLGGRSARIIQTSGMPGWAYRFMFRAPGTRALKAGLGFCGISPVRASYWGMMDEGEKRLKSYLEKAHALGRAGA